MTDDLKLSNKIILMIALAVVALVTVLGIEISLPFELHDLREAQTLAQTLVANTGRIADALEGCK